MNQTLKTILIIVIVMGFYSGIRYVGSVIRYGCANVPIVNVDGGDDCPPPFVLAGKLDWFLTGGSLMPLWNHDAIAVEKISWNIEKADPTITNEDDHRFYEQKIAVDITLMNGTTKRYELGTAYGCTGETKNEILDGKRFFGRVNCYFALSGTTFAAFNQKDGFRIERYDESAKDGSIKTTTLAEIK